MTNKEVTLCTVSYTHKNLLELNWDFVRALNPDLDYDWIVVENTPPDHPARLSASHPHFRVLEGPPKGDRIFAACYQAAEGFRRGVEAATTRFVIFIDPDFFVVQPNWIAKIVDHVKANNLHFFGAPIYPTLYHKWRYFPCTQLMLVDLEKISKADLDLKPRYEQLYDLSKPLVTKAPGPKPPPSTLAKFKNNLRLMFGRARIINSSYDTAWHLSEIYASQPELVECVKPVLKLSERRFQPDWINSGWNRALERLLPDAWAYIPKRPGYFTERSFKDRGAFDCLGQAWDETIFQDKPFSFHLRGALADSSVRDHEDEWPAIKEALGSFLNQ